MRGLASRAPQFLSRLNDPLLQDLTPEIPLVDLTALDGFMNKLEFGERELAGQQLEADVRISELVAQALVSVVDDLAVVEGERREFG